MYPLLFSITILIMAFALKYLSPVYALDKPDHRKHHLKPTSQIGGLVIGIIFLTVCYVLGLLPVWFMVGGIVSIILGAIDDNFSVSWYFKLMVQLLLMAFLSYIFWERFQFISFYGYTFPMSQLILLIIFSIWFVGIYNAVNLIDGLDGLAAGFVLIISISGIFYGSDVLSQMNLILAVILIAYILFNQRPGKVFMGDAGSLFLGFYVAVLPLLYMDMFQTNINVLPMTPFIILATFLIADTSRVFFTRILTGKNPMTADTIHFHHLVLKNSGSYLITLFIIFFVTTISCIFAVKSLSDEFGQLGIIIHLSLLFLFILTPPVPTYVKSISKAVKSFHYWQKNVLKKKPFWARTVFIGTMLFLQVLFMINSWELIKKANWQLALAIILVSIFIYLNRKDKIVISTLQIFISLIIIELGWNEHFSLIIQILTILLLIALAVFSIQRKNGTEFFHYSALDLLIVFISFGVISLTTIGMPLNLWLILMVLSTWYSIGFIFRRTIFSTYK